MFKVQVDGGQSTIVNSLEEALRVASSKLYISVKQLDTMRQSLKRGELACCSYGFTECYIHRQ